MPSLIKKSPIRIILNKKLDLKTNSKIFNNCKKFRTIIFTNNSSEKMISKFKKKNVDVICLKKNDYNLENILKKLAKLGVSNLLVEGGRKVFNSFLKKNLLTISISLEVVFFQELKKINFWKVKINMCKF